MCKSKFKLSQVSLTRDERKALNSLISDTTYSAVEMNLPDELIASLMEIIAAAFTLGVVTAKQSVPQPSLN